MRSSLIGRNAVKVAKDVVSAIKANKPVVALESTIITHGLPFPQNLEMAQTVESIIRDNGAVPATIGFVKGVPTVGLSQNELEYLATQKSCEKVSRRDIPYVMARGLSGGTTIAGTMILAHRAGINVFSTGGLGGVHRGVESTWDVSADLDELAKTPVGVVCSGPKSILDIPKTIEYLETKGVHVSTMGPPGTNIPGFYTKDSGVSSPFNFQTPVDAAQILYNTNKLDLQMGSVFCVPAPDYCALPNTLIDSVIDRAIAEAQALDISGKELTPFLLKKVWEATGGKSVQVNIEFVKNNARIGTEIASALCDIRATGSGSSIAVPRAGPSKPDTHTRIKDIPLEPVTAVRSQPKVLVFGAVAQDLACTLSNFTHQATSYKGRIDSHLGGVAYNVARAANYTQPESTRLVSIVGPDFKVPKGMDVGGLLRHDSLPTAKYIAMYDKKDGALIVACADMNIVHHMGTEHIKSQIETTQPRAVFFDGNLSTAQQQAILQSVPRPSSCFVAFEPTSVPKAADLAAIPSLGVYPEHDIDLALPNLVELESMAMAFDKHEKFNTDHWFPVIDALGINEMFRNRLDHLVQTTAELKPFAATGALQQAIRLLPYIPNLLIKDGANGVLLIKLVDTLRESAPPNTLQSPGARLGLLVEHYPSHKLDDQSQIVNVSGAGDTFCGVIAAECSTDINWIKHQDKRRQVIDRAQWAASRSILVDEAVSQDIQNYKDKI